MTLEGNQLTEKVNKIGQVLLDESRPLKERFRALFTLRNIGGEESINWISKAFTDPSALLKHELAYCLGQMQDPLALPVLTKVLEDTTQEPMVRHEAGEAIGAIGCPDSVELLRKYLNDEAAEVAETCQLALERIKWAQDNPGKTKSPYNSVDPTPPASDEDISTLERILLDDTAPLYERYKAMFALRNLNTESSVLSLCKGLFVGSALFKHEIAFVLGQMQNEASVQSLTQALQDVSLNEMVRHECAEALGSIATPEAVDTLKIYQKDPSRVVKESCDIALDMADYENSPEFQYANTALTV